MSLVLAVLVSLLLGFPKGDKPEYASSLIQKNLLNGADAIVRHSETKLTVRSKRQFDILITEVVTILSRHSSYGVLVMPYDKYSRVRFIGAAVYDSQGKLVKKIKKQDLQDRSFYDGFSVYSDNRYQYVDLRHVTYPYTVEYEYETTYHQTMTYPDWWPAGYGVAVEKSSLTVIAPPEIEVLTAEKNYSFVINEPVSDHERVRQWELSAFEPVENVQFSPPSNSVLPGVIISPQEFEVEGYNGSMLDWIRFGDFIYRINEGRSTVSSDLAAEVNHVTNGLTTDSARVAAIYSQLVQRGTRYVSVQLGIGGWQAYDANYVEDNRYGDCKALTYYTKGMLESAGIRSYPVLIGNGSYAPLNENFASPRFNHMILYLPDLEMWLECTSNNFPAGYIGADNSGREVLLITPEGGVVAKTPSSAVEVSQVRTVDSFELGDNAWTVKGVRNFKGVDHELVRAITYYYDEQERQEYFTENSTEQIDKLLSLEFSAHRSEPTAQCRYEAELRSVGRRSGSRIFFPVFPLYEEVVQCNEVSRDVPVHWSEHIDRNHTFVISIPKGYILESLPEDVTLSFDDIGTYSIKFRSTPGALQIERHLIIEPFIKKASSFTPLCDFLNNVGRADRAHFVLAAQ